MIKKNLKLKNVTKIYKEIKLLNVEIYFWIFLHKYLLVWYENILLWKIILKDLSQKQID